jgi:2-dehydro-3-deoxyphosphogluconate aldolase/(4S)-4-hydroxy-2-oxoglutarate aldolase
MVLHSFSTNLIPLSAVIPYSLADDAFGEEKIVEKIKRQITSLGVVPVVAIDDAKDVLALGEALIAGGLPCAEITFRTDAAEESIQTLSRSFPEMLVGAGTVLTTEQAKKAVGGGAQFLVTPGFDEAVVTWSIAQEVPIFPGVATPTEINMALRHGLNTLKFFPAEALGGVKTLKAITAPYGDVRFIPTGGINVQNFPDYLRLVPVIACGGSWLVMKAMISNGEFNTITTLAREAVQLAQQVRSE